MTALSKARSQPLLRVRSPKAASIQNVRIKRLKNIQLELHADFIKVVETSRGSKLKDPEKNNIFTGEFWTGKTALGLGLIDGEVELINVGPGFRLPHIGWNTVDNRTNHPLLRGIKLNVDFYFELQLKNLQFHFLQFAN